MRVIKLSKPIAFAFLIGIMGYLIIYAWRGVPIISGYGAKTLCSWVMIAGRQPEDVIQNELATGFLPLGSFSVNYEDSSATGTVFGLAKRKAIFRRGLGCSLVVEMSETELRNQQIKLARKPAVNTDTITWPMGDQIPNTPKVGINYEKLNYAIAQAFEEPSPDKLRRTRAVVVVYEGEIIFEKYAEGFDRRSKLANWSMTKSLVNALIGIMIKQGKLKLDQDGLVPAWQNDGRGKITLNDLMQMSSGLDWDENYYGPSDVTDMLFKKKDMGLYAANVTAKYEPGAVFYYSSGTTNIISRIVRETLGDEHYYRFPYEELFYKLGMQETLLEPDAGGTFVGSSFSFTSARDMARFGLLYLNDGIWQGNRILPEGWVKYTTTPASGATKGEYGAHFWLNAGEPGNPSHRTYPDVPVDLFWADGFEGQKVFIIPSKKLVVVKMSLSHGDLVDDNQFLAAIIDSLTR